ncbi:15110_t:CDS:2 [Dentiscutata erythropus]|uniref:15110_t:CDS:1 n=1 Tax=Dentiscutata erythropus TaxID=1348616 RepID=A0A9N8WPD6_9GLOM|nr:15110_t:CDS:2 [Dentiscutata erythropus]
MSSQNNSESSTYTTSIFTRWLKGQLSRSDKSNKENPTGFSLKKVLSNIPGSSFTSRRISRLNLEKRLKRSKSLTSSSVFSKHTSTTTTDDTSNIQKSEKKKRPNSVCAEPNYWVNDEIESVEFLSPFYSGPDIYGLSVPKKFQAPIRIQSLQHLHDQNLVPVTCPSRDDCLENTFIVRGSVEHFAYVRTLRKIGSATRNRPRPFYQVFMLRSTITKLSNTPEFSDPQREELVRYKTFVYSLNNKKRSDENETNDSPYRSNSINSRLISNFLTEFKPSYSPIVMNYRPSYASTKVLTIFDETLNKLVTKDLPLARRRKRLSKYSISKQFKYSGRGCSFPKLTNIIGVRSVEKNIIPSPITLTI